MGGGEVTIETDVAAVAKQFGEDPRLLQAIVTAEGDILKAVRCSVPTCADRHEALQITCRTVNHRRREFLHSLGASSDAAFVAFLGAAWAPVGAANDPRNLNANWVGNVRKLWLGTGLASGQP